MEWVSTNVLMNALGAPAVRTGSDVAYRVCKRAHEGLLRTRAKAFFKGSEELGPCDLPKEFWWAEGHAALDQDWTSGDFATSGPEARRTAWMADGPVREWRAYGVEWSREDAEDMGAVFLVSPTVVERGIVTQAKWDWEGANIDLIAIAESENLVDTFKLNERGGQARLEGWFADWFAKRNNGNSPSETERRKRAGLIKRSLPSL